MEREVKLAEKNNKHKHYGATTECACGDCRLLEAPTTVKTVGMVERQHLFYSYNDYLSHAKLSEQSPFSRTSRIPTHYRIALNGFHSVLTVKHVWLNHFL